MVVDLSFTQLLPNWFMETFAPCKKEMTKIFAIALFLSSSCYALAQYKLPLSAQISIGKLEVDKSSPQRAEVCTQLGWSLTKSQVRTMFRTYHLLKEGEQHAYYAYWSCWIRGTVTINGKAFSWKANPGNTLDTDWPDGAQKTLGGKHTDDPSGR